MPEGGHRNPLHAISPLISPSSYQAYRKMPDLDSPLPTKPQKRKLTWVLVVSYVTDWLCLIAAGLVGAFLGNITPNKRPFRLDDANIAFPFTEHETVTSSTLLICNAVIPIVVVLVVTLIFVPGPTVPKGTPQSLIWKRKLWELHTGWLGLALSLAGAWFITSGMKNLFGKPRPDLLSRCEPDYANEAAHYVLAGQAGGFGKLVYATICQSTDKSKLDDGFRSYPSGHSSSAAAGLIYLSFFLASKFSVVIPFVSSSSGASDSNSVAFPSRYNAAGNGVNTAYKPLSHGTDELSAPGDPSVAKQIASHGSSVLAVRRQAAAPPVYLLVLTLLPFFLAIFIASSRWFDFRHHGFDILFGFIIGTITAWFAFRYYHLPISSGAGWAWAPRSPDKAFWAGVGVYSYATDKKHWIRPGDEEEGLGGTNANDIELRGMRYRAKTDDRPNLAESSTENTKDRSHLSPPGEHDVRDDRSVDSMDDRI
ncbi:putative PAP2 superfamily-domain-containing protein [Seiridium cardinale]